MGLMNSNLSKVYLGDSVYVESIPMYGIRIYTNNGEEDENIIYLEEAVLFNLLKYLQTRSKVL